MPRNNKPQALDNTTLGAAREAETALLAQIRLEKVIEDLKVVLRDPEATLQEVGQAMYLIHKAEKQMEQIRDIYDEALTYLPQV